MERESKCRKIFKVLLMVVSVLLSGVVAEQPAPYAPSGWRPNGPAFELPQRPLPPQKQEYLPPVDPRRPFTPNNYDDTVDVSVQGLPVPEQRPIFQLSPINGQQYTGPSINADISKLNPSFQQMQYQQQLEKARQFARQREFEATRANTPSNGLPNQQSPRQFAFQTTSTTSTIKPELKTPKAETTTEPIDLNEGESFDDERDINDNKEKVSVEVSKQNLQEYPPELFLRPLAQLNAQPQFISLAQLGQLRAPLYYQPEQTAPAPGFDGPAHLSALPSVLAQRELLSQQAVAPSQAFAQNPLIVQQEQPALLQEPLNQYQPIINEYQPVQPQVQSFPQYQPQQVVVQPQGLNPIQSNQFPQQQPNQFVQPQQPNLFVQAQQPNQFAQPQQPNLYVQPQQPNQFAQPQQPNVFVQPQQPNTFVQQQPNQFAQPQQPTQFPQPRQPKDVEEIEQNDQQFVYQNYQPQFYQPQPANQYQNLEQPLFLAQPALNYQNQDQIYQNQFIPQQYDPNQYQVQPQQVFQDQNALQSGLDINQQGNGIEADQGEEAEEDEQEGPKATAVATAFGTRTQPRVFAKYGAPTQREQETTTTESSVQDVTEPDDAPAIAQATAVASGRRNARFRSRRVRPIFTLDRSGHLVLSQNQ
ncbi:unnamed protein product [Euphydryas editha]|uniref:Uncharacterized protein n=1 Tax=Euphydryas editha TaxID=104508 RepID=A0AAU9UPA2_EUPED|nr:unnamed protein product [Euphydryas editha]